MRLLQLPVAVVLLVFAASSSAIGSANFTLACVIQREYMIHENATLANLSNFVCEQSYSAGKSPAISIPLDLVTCEARIGKWNWQRTPFANISQWANSLVGFLLPALVFTLVIPRRHSFRIKVKHFYGNIGRVVLWLMLDFVIVIVDALGWIVLCFGFMGLLIVGAIDECLKDWSILRAVEIGLSDTAKPEEKLTRGQASYAMAVTLVGAFKPSEGDLMGKFFEKISGQRGHEVSADASREKLLHLYAHQTPFGIQVGAPVVFYLAAYLYAIRDSTTKLGDTDTAHAIAFGLWYGVIVLTATCCCASLGIGKSEVIEDIFGTPIQPKSEETNDSSGPTKFRAQHYSIELRDMSDQLDQGSPPSHTIQHSGFRSRTSSLGRKIYSTFQAKNRDPEYKATWLWDRTHCLRQWTASDKLAKLSGYPKNINVIHTVAQSKLIRVVACQLAFSIVAIICALAIAICYYTPIVGIGCRTMTILMYAVCQFVLIGIWLYHSEDHHGKNRQGEDEKPLPKALAWLHLPLYGLAGAAFIFSIFSAIGGTIMQLLGVYNNCMCKAGPRFWKSPAGGRIELATDTQAHQESGRKWNALGIAGIVFIALVCVIGWGYYMRMKAKCLKLIHSLRDDDGIAIQTLEGETVEQESEPDESDRLIGESLRNIDEPEAREVEESEPSRIILRKPLPYAVT